MKIKTSHKLLFTTLLIVFLTSLLGLEINALTDNEEVKTFIREYFGTRDLIIGVVLSAIALLVFTYFQLKYSQQNEQSTEKENLAKDDEVYIKEYYEKLKERYRKRYRGKLDGRFEITLEVSENWDGKNTQQFKGEYEGKGQISEAFEYIRSAFEKQGRLLIFGNPGVGKTVLLLKLALELLQETNLEKKEAFPVIFNLASWRDEYTNFKDWLVSVLNSGEGLSKDLAEKLLYEERIIILLDGLDELARNETEEIATEIRAKCLHSLNEYLDRGKRVVICCRASEFAQMQKLTGKEAPVSAKTLIKDLTIKQVKVALWIAKQKVERTDREVAENLLSIIRDGKNESLIKVIQIPFYFTTALEVVDKTIFDEADLPKDEKNLKNHLQEKFVKKKLSKTPNPNNFEHGKTIHWLIVLAKLMNSKDLVTFELADLQPTDLINGRLYNFYNRAVMSQVVTILGFHLENRSYKSLERLDYKKIIPEDSIKLQISKTFLPFFTFSNLILLVIGIFFGTAIGIIINLFNDEGIFINGIRGLAIAIIPTCFMKLLGILESIKEIKKIASLKKPYQRVRGGFNINVVLGGILLIFFIFCWSFASFIDYKVQEIYSYQESIDDFLLTTSIEISEGKSIEEVKNTIIKKETWEEYKNLREVYKKVNIPFEVRIFLILLNGFTLSIFMFGIFPVVMRILATPLIRHLVLRYFLFREGAMPLKYATFLDYAADTQILEKDGGHWRFRHQNLQDYFASLDEQEKPPISN